MVVTERLYGRPTERFTLLPDGAIELRLGRRAVRVPPPRPVVMDLSPLQQQQQKWDSRGPRAAAGAFRGLDLEAGADEYGAEAEEGAEVAPGAGVTRRWVTGGSAEGGTPDGVLAALFGAQRELLLPGRAMEQLRAAGGGAGAGAGVQRAGGVMHVAVGSGGWGDPAQVVISVRRPPVRGKYTIMRASSGIVGRKKHLPLPVEILKVGVHPTRGSDRRGSRLQPLRGRNWPCVTLSCTLSTRYVLTYLDPCVCVLPFTAGAVARSALGQAARARGGPAAAVH